MNRRPRWIPRTVAAAISAVLAVAAVSGCVRLPAPAVQQDLTTGEKLRSIDAISRDPAAFVEHERPVRTADTGRELADEAARTARIAQVAAWCAATRERLVAGPVALEATVYAPAGTTPECADLESTLRSQATRPLVRRASESAPVAVEIRVTPIDWAFYDWSTRDRRPAWWWMAKRVRMMGVAERDGAPACRSFEEPDIPAPNPFSVPAVFRIRADGGAER